MGAGRRSGDRRFAGAAPARPRSTAAAAAPRGFVEAICRSRLWRAARHQRSTSAAARRRSAAAAAVSAATAAAAPRPRPPPQCLLRLAFVDPPSDPIPQSRPIPQLRRRRRDDALYITCVRGAVSRIAAADRGRRFFRFTFFVGDLFSRTAPAENGRGRGFGLSRSFRSGFSPSPSFAFMSKRRGAGSSLRSLMAVRLKTPSVASSSVAGSGSAGRVPVPDGGDAVAPSAPVSGASGRPGASGRRRPGRAPVVHSPAVAVVVGNIICLIIINTIDLAGEPLVVAAEARLDHVPTANKGFSFSVPSGPAPPPVRLKRPCHWSRTHQRRPPP